MRLTVNQLRRIIKEEVNRVLRESSPDSPVHVQVDLKDADGQITSVRVDGKPLDVGDFVSLKDGTQGEVQWLGEDNFIIDALPDELFYGELDLDSIESRFDVEDYANPRR